MQLAQWVQSLSQSYLKVNKALIVLEMFNHSKLSQPGFHDVVLRRCLQGMFSGERLACKHRR